MPRRKLSPEEKEEKTRQKLYAKILADDPLTITELGKLLNKESCTIRKWEKNGIVKKPQIVNGVRRYFQKDLFEVLHDLYNHDWQRNVINLEEIKKIADYLESVIEINSERKIDVNSDPYGYKGELY